MLRSIGNNKKSSELSHATHIPALIDKPKTGCRNNSHGEWRYDDGLAALQALLKLANSPDVSARVIVSRRIQISPDYSTMID